MRVRHHIRQVMFGVRGHRAISLLHCPEQISACCAYGDLKDDNLRQGRLPRRGVNPGKTEALWLSGTCTCTEILLQLGRSRGWTSKCHFPGAQTVFPRHLTFSIETHLLVSPAKEMENLRRLKTKNKKKKRFICKGS